MLLTVLSERDDLPIEDFFILPIMIELIVLSSRLSSNCLDMIVLSYTELYPRFLDIIVLSFMLSSSCLDTIVFPFYDFTMLELAVELSDDFWPLMRSLLIFRKPSETACWSYWIFF